jgi:hypothetical protein
MGKNITPKIMPYAKKTMDSRDLLKAKINPTTIKIKQIDINIAKAVVSGRLYFIYSFPLWCVDRGEKLRY